MFRCRDCGFFSDINYCDKCHSSEMTPFYLALAHKSLPGVLKSSVHWTNGFRRRVPKYSDEELAVILFNEQSFECLDIIKAARNVFSETRDWYPNIKDKRITLRREIQAFFEKNIAKTYYAQVGGTLAEPEVRTYRLTVIAIKARTVRFWVEQLVQGSDTGYIPQGMVSVPYTNMSGVMQVLTSAVQFFAKSDNIRLHLLEE